MVDEITIREAQREVTGYLRAKGEGWTGLNNHYYVATHLVEEVGELARAIINMESKVTERNRRGADRSHEEKLTAVRDGLGDVLFHLLKLSVAYGLDLEEAFHLSMRNIRAKYPEK